MNTNPKPLILRGTATKDIHAALFPINLFWDKSKKTRRRPKIPTHKT
jgi:hypothetical protein